MGLAYEFRATWRGWKKERKKKKRQQTRFKVASFLLFEPPNTETTRLKGIKTKTKTTGLSFLFCVSFTIPRSQVLISLLTSLSISLQNLIFLEGEDRFCNEEGYYCKGV
ncbi:hypothetical protein S245_017338 [Arachis hypogaea]